MTERLPPLNALKAFESAARHLSFKRAAAELSVTPAAISHQIKSLEDYLGIPLFRRVNRGLALTPAAQAAVPKLSEGFDTLAEAVARMRPRPDSGQLTVSVAPSFAARWLMPRLHRFFAAQPDLDVRISARTRLMNKRGDDNAVERTTVENWLEESDVAILYGHGDYPGYRVDKLVALTLAPICSPQLVQGKNPLRRPEDLQHHTLVHDDTGTRYDGVAFWDVWLKAAGRYQPRIPLQSTCIGTGSGERRARRGGDVSRARERGTHGGTPDPAVRTARAAAIRVLPGMRGKRSAASRGGVVPRLAAGRGRAAGGVLIS